MSPVRPGACRPRAVSFGGDQLVEPADLALHGLEAVALELEGVAVELLAGAGDRGAGVRLALLEPAAPALEDPQPDVGIGLGEEGEPDAEGFVVPRRRAALGELLLQPLLAVSGELVDVLLAPAGPGLARRCRRW